MQSEKLIKIKRLISQLNYEELPNLSSFLLKKKNEAWQKLRNQKIQEKIDSIRSLSAGTEVVFTDAQYEISACIGKIVRHMGRSSKRTLVDFGEKGSWRIPSSQLSTDTSEENLMRLRAARKASAAMNKIFSKAMSSPPDKRPRCRACFERLDKGQSRRFLNEKVFKKYGKSFYTTLHRHRKDCSKKSEWTRTRKRLKGEVK